MRLSRFWLGYFVVFALLLAYTGLGYLASRPVFASLKLDEGAQVSMSFFRFSADKQPLEMIFSRQQGQERPELGDPRLPAPVIQDGFAHYKNPGAKLEITAAVGGAGTERYFALPVSSTSAFALYRPVAPVLADHPGAFVWPPYDGKGIVLPAGASTLLITVVALDPALRGEEVRLLANGPLGFKVTRSGFGWLWFSWLWPIYLTLYLCSGVLVFLVKWWIRR